MFVWVFGALTTGAGTEGFEQPHSCYIQDRSSLCNFVEFRRVLNTNGVTGIAYVNLLSI